MADDDLLHGDGDVMDVAQSQEGSNIDFFDECFKEKIDEASTSCLLPSLCTITLFTH